MRSERGSEKNGPLEHVIPQPDLLVGIGLLMNKKQYHYDLEITSENSILEVLCCMHF